MGIKQICLTPTQKQETIFSTYILFKSGLCLILSIQLYAALVCVNFLLILLKNTQFFALTYKTFNLYHFSKCALEVTELQQHIVGCQGVVKLGV